MKRGKTQGNQVDILIFLSFSGNEKIGKHLNFSAKKNHKTEQKTKHKI